MSQPTPAGPESREPDGHRGVAARFTVRRQLFWLVAGFIIVSGGLAAVILNYLRTQTLESRTRVTQSFAHVLQEQTERTLQSVDHALKTAETGMALLGASGPPDQASVRALLIKQMEMAPSVRAMWVMDAKGRIVFSSDGSNVGASLAERDYFQIYRTEPERSFSLGAPVRGPTLGQLTISASRPLRTTGGAFSGIVAAALDPSYFDALWRAADLGAGSSVVLLRRDGVLMMRSPFDESLIGKSFGSLPMFKEMTGRSVGTAQGLGTDGVARMFAFRALSSHPDLVVVVGESREAVLGPWRRLAALALAIWATGSIAIIVLSVFLSQAWRLGIHREAHTERLAERLLLATNHASIAVWDWDVEENKIYASPSYFAMLGYDPEEKLTGREEWLQRIHAEDRNAVAKKLEAALTGEEAAYQYEARMLHADGSFRWLMAAGRVLERDAQGKATRILGSRQDITDRKQAEEGMRNSLLEKSALLKEVHHRVKNNLQVINSLLRLEAGRSVHPGTQSVLREMQGRIQAMALLHETLYRSGTFATIDLGAYLTQLATQSFRALNAKLGAIQLDLDLASIRVAMDEAVPCGLLVNELISNCLKHGFPDGRTGSIRVLLQAMDGSAHTRLSVSDTGVGLPSDFESKRGRSLGLQLVSDLARQLGGTLETGSGPGASFTVTFVAGPAPSASPTLLAVPA